MKWLKCKQCREVDKSTNDSIGTSDKMHCPDCADEKGKATLCRYCCPTWHGTKWHGGERVSKEKAMRILHNFFKEHGALD